MYCAPPVPRAHCMCYSRCLSRFAGKLADRRANYLDFSQCRMSHDVYPPLKTFRCAPIFHRLEYHPTIAAGKTFQHEHLQTFFNPIEQELQRVGISPYCQGMRNVLAICVQPAVDWCCVRRSHGRLWLEKQSTQRGYSLIAVATSFLPGDDGTTKMPHY